MTVAPQDVHDWLTNRVATYLRRNAADIEAAVPLTEYGLDSLAMLAIVADVEDEYDLVFDPALAWDQPSIDALSAVLMTMIEDKAKL